MCVLEVFMFLYVPRLHTSIKGMQKKKERLKWNEGKEECPAGRKEGLHVRDCDR